jgi:hypothetical protein
MVSVTFTVEIGTGKSVEGIKQRRRRERRGRRRRKRERKNK